MSMTITFPGGDRVEARFKGLTVATEQDGSAPAPFDLFLASIGTCAGYYVARFCSSRKIPLDGLHIEQHWTKDAETGLIVEVELRVHLSEAFPERYRPAVLRAVDQCSVKRHLVAPPAVRTVLV